MLPPTLKRFFWDTQSEHIDLELQKDYVISRILELGDDAAVLWLEKRFASEDITKVVGRTRALSAKSRNYWKIKYHPSEHA